MSEVYFETLEKVDTKFYGYKQNINFYQHLDLHHYKTFAKASGLLEREDVFVLMPYVLKAASILEVGAGFGRAVDALTSLAPQAKITALEVCAHMCQFMQRRYLNNFNVRVVQSDFLKNSLGMQFDLIGMFWTTLLSFAPQEQYACFQEVAKLLSPQGKFAIDLFESSAKAPHRGLAKHVGVASTELLGQRFFGWTPTDGELAAMAKEAQLKRCDELCYRVDGVSRRFVIFEKIS